MTATVDQSGWNGRKRFLVLRDGRRLAYIDESGGRNVPLLLLHGYTDSSRSWSLVMPHLREYRLVAPDLPGHGLSTPAPLPTLEGFADDVIKLADALGIKRFAVAGHSMGAMTALVLAARHGERVTGLACICGSLQPSLLTSTTLGAEIQALADPIDPNSRFFREWYRCAVPVNAGFMQWNAQEAAGMPAAVWQALFAMMEATDLRQTAKQVFASVLLLAGGEDALFDETHRVTLRGAFPEATTEILAGLSHNPHWESPQRVADALRGHFL